MAMFCASPFGSTRRSYGTQFRNWTRHCLKSRKHMSDANFRARWESLLLKKSIPESLTLVRAPSVAALERISAAARTFLTETGLPKSAAPCLIFEEVGKGLPKLWEVYSPQPEWKPEEKKAVEPYLMMGSDGAGSPICANERDETIVLLDHELLFTPRQLLKRVMFMNTSVSQLAECLLEYN